MSNSDKDQSTPRTEKELYHTIPRVTNEGYVSADFARQLERELTERTEERDEALGAVRVERACREQAERELAEARKLSDASLMNALSGSNAALLPGLREALKWKPNTPQLENAMTYAWESALKSFISAIELAAATRSADACIAGERQNGAVHSHQATREPDSKPLDDAVPSSTALTFKEQEVADALDVAEGCVHDQIRDTSEREHVQEGLKKVRALALQALSAITPTRDELVEAAGDITKIEDGLTADRVGLQRLFDAMEEKLYAKSLEGRGGWNNDCTMNELEQMLKEHIDKPWTPRNLVDIANFCMMLWNRHNPIAPTDDRTKA